MVNANVTDFFGEGVDAPQSSGYGAAPAPPPKPAPIPGQVGKWQWTGTQWAWVGPGTANNPGGAAGAYQAGNDATRSAFDATHQSNNPFTFTNLKRGVAAVSTLGGSEIARATGNKQLGFAYNPVGAIGNEKYAQPATNAAGKLVGIDSGGAGGGGAGGFGGPAGDPTPRVEQGTQDISTQLAPFIDESGQQGDKALDEFYGIDKPENNVKQDALDFAGETAIDPSLARNAEVDRAFDMSSGLVDSIMNTPSQTKILGDQVLSQQLALGRSSPGGIGNVQAGVKAAMGQAPQLQRDAQQASIQEQVARASAATNAANVYAGVAQGTADRDVRIAEGNQTAATNVLSTLTQQYGMDLNYTTEERGQIGQMARDFYANQAKFVGMDVEQQAKAFDAIVRIYGIKGDFAAAIAKISADEGIGEMDAIKLVLGGVDAYAKYKSMGAL